MLDSDADWPERESEENHKLLIEYDILLGIYSKSAYVTQFQFI
jgi:hypothetical protein